MEPLILIVDDTPKNLQILSGILSEQKYRISFATSGKVALSILENLSPDLILLDVMMPEMDGFELCERILSKASTKNLPIIFLSAKNEIEDVVKAFSLGAVDYVSKPFRPGELLARVKTHVELKKSREELSLFRERMKEELEVAVATQTSLVANHFPESNYFQISSFFRPQEEIGGDVISFFTHNSEERLDLFFADVSGHGISAAMVSGMAILAFKNSSQLELSPSQGLQNIHNMLLPLVFRHHITAVYLSLYPKAGYLEYSYAGHHSFYLIRKGKLEPLDGRGTLLLFPFDMKNETYRLDLEEGDRILLFSDGMFELFNSKGDLMDLHGFVEILESHLNHPFESFLENISQLVMKYCENKRGDDMTMLLLEYKPNKP